MPLTLFRCNLRTLMFSFLLMSLSGINSHWCIVLILQMYDNFFCQRKTLYHSFRNDLIYLTI
jgi:hypothetical protein